MTTTMQTNKTKIPNTTKNLPQQNTKCYNKVLQIKKLRTTQVQMIKKNQNYI